MPSSSTCSCAIPKPVRRWASRNSSRPISRRSGGQAAVRAEQAGLTQKKRITEHLANVIRSELTSPEGYHARRLGLIGALNQF